MWRSMLCLCLLGGVATLGITDEPKKAAAEEKQIESKLKDGKQGCFRANTINFSKELGVPLEFLGSIGNRIYQARKAPDPVELAMAAQSLKVAEQVAQK